MSKTLVKELSDLGYTVTWDDVQIAWFVYPEDAKRHRKSMKKKYPHIKMKVRKVV